MSNLPKRIGIFGGTFNPVHLGHIEIASNVFDKLGLHKIYFMPSGVPPHKNQKGLAPPEERFKMVEMAIEKDKRFEVLDYEIKKKTASYTVETIYELLIKFKDSKIFLILGADAALDIFSWKDPQNIFKVCTFVIVSRPGYILEEFKKKISMLQKKGASMMHIIYLEESVIEISSSRIRERIKNGEDASDLLSKKVYAYVKEMGFYKGL